MVKQFSWTKFAWNTWCVSSLIGIWPRFLEPYSLATSHLRLPIPNLPSDLNGLRILQFSDLHLQSNFPQWYLNKISKRINALKPDMIVFTGDFLNYAQLEQPERLTSFLKSLSARYGCYAILGNHDYAQYVSTNEAGDYDLGDAQTSFIKRGFRRLFSPPIHLSKKVTARAKNVGLHALLTELLEKTSFTLLHNETSLVPVKDSFLNLTGLGEHILGRCLPSQAFQNYNSSFPGIVLVHNPDAVSSLYSYPGELILCGHSHGYQINLPWLRHKLTALENKELARGLFQAHNKWIYVNRGIGGTMTFRWFSIPELSLFTLEAQS
ncbi:MAG: UDP-2,3-diacylglucosamine diphosphatase LpxG [Parachlamydiaceae bacterium]|nr:UDP-2,3-diacylglucosamine diphosphatase LpxG [Parachlamydiaceae bacterium]